MLSFLITYIGLLYCQNMKTVEVKSGESLITSLKQRGSFLSVRELSEILAVSPLTLYRMVWKSKIPFVRIAGSIRFDPHIVSLWLEANNTYAKTKQGRTVWFVDIN